MTVLRPAKESTRSGEQRVAEPHARGLTRLADQPATPRARVTRSRLHPAIYAGMLVLLTVALAACGGAPDLVLDREVVDLGQVVNGELRTIEVPVRNAGKGTLVIEAVSTSCGCTTASVEPSAIEPGQGGILQVRFDSGAHGPEANGPVTRQVFIASNDPERPEVEFQLQADVVPPSP